jgi:hypothetical protein
VAAAATELRPSATMPQKMRKFMKCSVDESVDCRARRRDQQPGADVALNGTDDLRERRTK